MPVIADVVSAHTVQTVWTLESCSTPAQRLRAVYTQTTSVIASRKGCFVSL